MSDYNFNLNLSTDRYTIEIDTAAQYGYFQNNYTGTEGGLWFNGSEIIDVDGVPELPASVERALNAAGYSFAEDDPDVNSLWRAESPNLSCDK
jgi:hypothetical protein